jgi:hypothetical protein
MTKLPPGLRLTVETDPRPEDIKFLEASLYEFNSRTTGIFDGQPLSVFARAPDGSPVAGAFSRPQHLGPQSEFVSLVGSYPACEKPTFIIV